MLGYVVKYFVGLCGWRYFRGACVVVVKGGKGDRRTVVDTMGANTSSLLSEDIEEMARETNLSPNEIKRLYKRFQKLDRNMSGTLEVGSRYARKTVFPCLVALGS